MAFAATDSRLDFYEERAATASSIGKSELQGRRHMTQRSITESAQRAVFDAQPTTRACLTDKVTVSESLIGEAAVNQSDAPPLAFVWDLSRRLVERLGLTRGQSVFDVCCGTGATAMPAAQRVGHAGHVLGIDGGARLILRARARAKWLGFTHAQFQVGDFETATLRFGGFDAVICAFGIAQSSDPAGAVQMLWSQVRPGGVLAIALFARGLFHPADDFLARYLTQQHLALATHSLRCNELGAERELATLLHNAGVSGFRISTEPCEQALRSPEDWWSILCASVYREALHGLEASAVEQLRHDQIRAIEELRIHSVRTDALFAIARKPLTR